jgi:hypothetical protein
MSHSPYGPNDPNDPLHRDIDPHSVEGVLVEQKIPEWLKAALAVLAVFWSIGAVGGIWYIAHRIDSTCDTQYAEVAGRPGVFDVLCVND